MKWTDDDKLHKSLADMLVEALRNGTGLEPGEYVRVQPRGDKDVRIAVWADLGQLEGSREVEGLTLPRAKWQAHLDREVALMGGYVKASSGGSWGRD